MKLRAFSLLTLALAGTALVLANTEADIAAAGQAMADEIRSVSGAQLAFIATGQIRASGKSEDLSTYAQFGSDQIAVLTLTGKQIKAAFERSVLLYPNANPGFLHISGAEASFKRAKASERVTSVTVNGAPLDPAASYTVAMPESLASGSFGYFTIWEKNDSTKVLEGKTLLSILSGKSLVATPSRWRVGE